MENFIFHKTQDEQGRIVSIKISGLLILENSQELKKEFLGLIDSLGNRLKINISNVTDIDLSFVQLFMAFVRQMNIAHVACQFEWKLDEDQKTLFENVGLSNELIMNN
ncbi:hypothetical protein AQPE_0034 [Aquipluma nitroreducens]|uniref:STAS domain-containing protein n=1 Tax=Aquipluma nitroreducens TaxID=2010828 RepID=A0A5K7S2N0_9BACT|nr:hypothetical protein [Aquipluma nitroreducens]BBE15898.1 hypothetical protein AQPE_0034 [Aquipluma nitroreducens]